MNLFVRRALATVLMLASIDREAGAQVVKMAFTVAPAGPALVLTGSAPTPDSGLIVTANSALLSAPFAAPNSPAAQAPAVLGARALVQPTAKAVAASVAYNGAAAAGLSVAAPNAIASGASALFDGSTRRFAAASVEPSDPVGPPKALSPRPRRFWAPFGVRLARWSGTGAVWSYYRDGALVERYAAALIDHGTSRARRAVSARKLGELGKVEAVPTLAWAHESDPSPHVRRAALAAIMLIARSSEPRLIRTLKTNPLSGSREAAAATLSWIVKHSEAVEAVEALATAATLDLSEDARLAAIRSLALAQSPKAMETLVWMRGQETRPHMRSAIELALGETRRRMAARGMPFHHHAEEEQADTRGPLHETALKRAMVVASVFVAIEMIGGFVTGNVALKADALHHAADQLINGAALFSIWLGRRPPNSRKSYGYLKVESVVGLIGAAAIAYMGLEMGLETWQHIFHPAAAATWSVALFALASVGSNMSTALMLWRHQGETLSMRGAFLHALVDMTGSLGVILSTSAAILLGWTWLQPVVVAFIVIMVLKTAWSLGKPAWNVLIDAVPAGIDLDRIEADLLTIPGAAGVRDIRVWALNSRTTALTATVFIRPGAEHDRILASAKALLREKHGIRHMTVQVETMAGVLP